MIWMKHREGRLITCNLDEILIAYNLLAGMNFCCYLFVCLLTICWCGGEGLLFSLSLSFPPSVL